MNLIMFCYNFMRTKNIMGFEKMDQAIQKWIPDYKKASGSLKIALDKRNCSPNQQSYFRKAWPGFLIKAA